jgi:GNAT superfamily N-acetyltransferase
VIPATSTAWNPHRYSSRVTVTYSWRGSVANAELNRLHAEAFDTQLYSGDEWNWVELLDQHSLGWVVARDGDALVGFVNVLWDGLVQAWLQDTMVASGARLRGIGTQLVKVAVREAKSAGCEWLHVDYDEHLRPFYLDACGFSPTSAGLMAL